MKVGTGALGGWSEGTQGRYTIWSVIVGPRNVPFHFFFVLPTVGTSVYEFISWSFTSDSTAARNGGLSFVSTTAPDGGC